jgi:hypothetical protein
MKTIYVLDRPGEELPEPFHAPKYIDFLADHYGALPKSARLFEKAPSTAQGGKDVTPKTVDDVYELESLEGPLYVVHYPGDPGTVIAASVIISLALAATAYALTPSAGAGQFARANQQAPSPNGEVGDRRNKPRLGGMVPYILGREKAIPDLLSSYKFYQNNQGVQLSYGLISEGTLAIETDTAKEGETRVSDIGSSVEFYGPNTIPGDTPQASIGAPITEALKVAQRVKGINGQLLESPNSRHFKSATGVSDITFKHPNIIEIEASSGVDFAKVFKVGENLTLTNQTFDRGVESGSISLTGVEGTIETLFDYGGPSGTLRLLEQSWTFTDSSVIDNFRVSDKVSWTGLTVLQYTPPGPSPPTFDIDLNGSGRIDEIDADNNKFVFVWLGGNPVNIEYMDNFGYDHTTTGLDIEVLDTTTRTVDVSGSFTLSGVTSTQLTLDNPSAVQRDWGTIQYLVGDKSGLENSEFVTIQDRPVGPYFVDEPNADELLINLIALNGLYKKTSTRQYDHDVDFKVSVTPADASGTATGAAVETTITLDGSANLTNRIADSFRLSLSGRSLVSIQRVTNTDYDYSGTVVDDVQLEEIYYLSPHSVSDLGDVTTVYIKTATTETALSSESLLFNVMVTRKIPTRISGTTFTTDLHATSQVDEIIAFVAQDPKFGRRQLSELDLDSIYGAVAAARAKFGDPKATEFNHTFDNPDATFEDILATIAGAAHCIPYRRGDKIKLTFDGEKTFSTLLFNELNMVADMPQKVQTSFGHNKDHDGVEYVYRHNYQPATMTLGTNPTNPKRIEANWVASKFQAYFHANKAWNRIRYEREATEFKATEEAALIAPKDRIVVEDTTRDGAQTGDIEAQNGTTLTLSRDVVLEPSTAYKLQILHKTATVEELVVSSSPASNQVALTVAPSQDLVTSDTANTKTKFSLVKATESTKGLWIFQEAVKSEDSMAHMVKATNYDARVHQADDDYTTGVIDVNGDPI